MNTLPFDLRPTPVTFAVLALALLAQAGAARADETFEASLEGGLGLVSGDPADRAQFGQYNGLRTRRAVPLLGGHYERRDNEAGKLVQFDASDALGRSREFDLLWKRGGDWKFTARYGELTRVDPWTINTGVLGAGTTAPQVVVLPSFGAGNNIDLKVQRTALGLGLAKVLGPGLSMEVSLKSENREGSRLWGRGMTCPSTVAPGCLGTTGAQVGYGVLLLPEPIDANHSQLEARLNYGWQALRLSVGYYGSFFNNGLGALTPGVAGSLYNAVGTLLPLADGLQAILSQPMALAPDNQFHQLDVTGSYRFTPTTHANFKLARGRATQDQDFAAAGLVDAPAGVADLGGRVDTTLVHAAISARPVPRLSLTGSFRWEDRDDRTPVAAYNVVGAETYTNRQLPYEKAKARVKAGWQFAPEWRGALGAEYEAVDRGIYTSTSAVSGLSALRQETEEVTLRGELRRQLSGNVSGALVLARSERDGSNWLRPNSGPGVTEVADEATGFSPFAVFMPTLADRRRDSGKLLVDWQPTDELALQLSVQSGRDRYDAPTEYGVRSSGMDALGLDASYALSDKWSFDAHARHGRERLHQARPAGYVLSLDNDSTSVGGGVTAQPIAKLTVNAGVTWYDDRSVYAQGLDPFAGGDLTALLAATGGLPDIVFRQVVWKLDAGYELSKTSEVRFALVHQRSRLQDWTWGWNGVPYVYSDGSTVSQQPRQNVTFAGVTYVYRWR